MASNCIADVRKLCMSAVKSSQHPLHDSIITPAQWATEAGYKGSAASPLRQHMARKSSNGVGRSGRYGQQSAQDMLDLLDEADRFVAAKTEKAQSMARTRVRRALDKNRASAKRGARQAKGTATASRRKAKSSQAAPAAE